MTVSFVHCTPDAEGLIVDMARVSNPANQGKPATAPRLISYLIKHKHWSPFEMAGLCLKIETERDISAQIIRHRSFSFQEFSTRYAATVIAECPLQRFQDPTNRQNSLDAVDDVSQQYWSERTASVIADSWRLYDELLRNGMAKETARRILPLCTPTTMYMHGTLRSWIHYLEIRCSAETQLEHRQVAESCKAIFVAKFPAISTALNWTV
jgi:thymidylate synthase (FAD)